MTSPYKTVAAVIVFLDKYDRWTRKEFTAVTGLSRASAERMITALHRKGIFRIDEWVDDTTGRATVAVYTRGAGPDAKRRPALTGKQRTQAYAARKKNAAATAIENTMALWAGKE